jgi:hypothetical protein
MSNLNIKPQIFDPNLNGACTWNGSLMMNDCKFTMNDESKITKLKNISPVFGPSLWVPVISNETIPPSCVKINSKIVCLHYPDDIQKELNDLDDDVNVVQQTFSKINSKNNSNLWIQDYPPKPVTLINNPSNTFQITNSDVLLVQSEEDFKNNPNPPKLLSTYKMLPTIPQGANKSYITLYPNEPNEISFLYNDSSDIAPNCIINTQDCTLDAPTNKCMITCPTMDEINIIKYSYNKKHNLWVDPALNTLI